MKRTQRRVWMLCVGAAAAGSLAGSAQGQAPASPSAPAQQAAPAEGRQGRGQQQRPLIDAQNLRMPADARDPHATVPVFGAPSSEGYYIVGQHYNPKQVSRPHYHDKDRWVTVVSGTWYTGEGDVYRPETMVPLKPGSVMFHPAGFHHYDGAMDDQEVLLLIAGYGPVSTVQSEVDAQGNPVRRGGGGGGARRGGAPAGPTGAPAPEGRQ